MPSWCWLQRYTLVVVERSQEIIAIAVIASVLFWPWQGSTVDFIDTRTLVLPANSSDLILNLAHFSNPGFPVGVLKCISCSNCHNPETLGEAILPSPINRLKHIDAKNLYLRQHRGLELLCTYDSNVSNMTIKHLKCARCGSTHL